MIETGDLVRRGDSTAESGRVADYTCKRCNAQIAVSLDVEYELRDMAAVKQHGECAAK